MLAFSCCNVFSSRLAKTGCSHCFRTPTKIYQEEQEIRTAKCELNCYAGTVTGVMYVDATAISTHTFTGTGYTGFIGFAAWEDLWSICLYSLLWIYNLQTLYDWMGCYSWTPRITVWRTETFNWPAEAHLKASTNAIPTGRLRPLGLFALRGWNHCNHTLLAQTEII